MFECRPKKVAHHLWGALQHDEPCLETSRRQKAILQDLTPRTPSTVRDDENAYGDKPHTPVLAQVEWIGVMAAAGFRDMSDIFEHSVA